MKTAAKIKGELRFEDARTFKSAIESLASADWPLGDVKKHADPKSLKIDIPADHYQDLFHLLEEICAKPVDHKITWATHDGMFRGAVWTPKRKKHVELSHWARSRVVEQEPQESEFEDDEKYLEAYLAWADHVVDLFVENPD